MKNSISKFTFKYDKNLLNEDVLMVLRNSDKKHIASLTDIHFNEMNKRGYNPNDFNDVICFLENMGFF